VLLGHYFKFFAKWKADQQDVSDATVPKKELWPC